VTDANGRYSIPGIGIDVMVYLNPAPETEYKTLCNTWKIDYWSHKPHATDLPVFHKSWAGDRLPPDSWTSDGIYGVVSERVDGRLQPIEGATVGGNGIENATTNAKGFYMSCLLAFDWGDTAMTAVKDGYHSGWAEWDPGYMVVNFLLTRK
jgi:hypothetical protein